MVAGLTCLNGLSAGSPVPFGPLQAHLNPHVLVGMARDQQGGVLAGGDLPEPFGQQGEAVLVVRHEGQVGYGPEQPAQQARQAQAPQVGDGIQGPNHSHAAEIKPAEGFGFGAVDPGQDVLGDPGAHLHGRAGHARQGFGVGRVAVVAEVTDHPDCGELWD